MVALGAIIATMSTALGQGNPKQRRKGRTEVVIRSRLVGHGLSTLSPDPGQSLGL